MPFIRNKRVSIPFDGGVVVVDLKPLSYEALLSIQGAADAMEGSKRIADAVREHAVLAGSFPCDEAGKLVSIDEVCRVAYFTPLMIKLGQELIAAAKPSDPTMPAQQSGGSTRETSSVPQLVEPLPT